MNNPDTFYTQASSIMNSNEARMFYYINKALDRSTFCRKKTLLNTSPAKKNNGPTTGQRNIMIPFIRISVFFSFCLILLFPITYKTATAVLIRRTIQNLFSATVIQIHPPVSGRTHPLFQIFLLPWLHLLHWYLQEAHTFFHLQVHRHNRFV